MKHKSVMYQPARSTPTSSCLSLHRDSPLCEVGPHGPWLPCSLAPGWICPWRDLAGDSRGWGGEWGQCSSPTPSPSSCQLAFSQSTLPLGPENCSLLSPPSLGMLPSLEQPWLTSSVFCHSWFNCLQHRCT